MLVMLPIFPAQSHINIAFMLKRKVAFARNRTTVSRVAGENSTTEPPMLVASTIFPAQSHI